MHTFQPFNIHDIDLNPYNIVGNSGVCVTCEIDGKVNTNASANVSFGTLWGKEVIFAFLREDTYTKELLDKSDFFSVTFFDDSYKSSLKYLKSISGRVENKIEQIGMHVNRKIDIPFIDEGHLVFLCDKLACIPFSNDLESGSFISKRIANKQYKSGNLHVMYVGEILEVVAR